MEPRVMHLSLVAGTPLLDRGGGRLGRVDDLIVRLGGEGYPPVTGVLASVAGRQVFVSADEVDELSPAAARLRGERLDLRPFERRPQEVLLRKDVLDRQLINVDGARLVRANEIEVARLDGWWRVVGVDTGLRGFARRLLPRRLAARLATGSFLDWASVEPFTGHVPTVRLRVPHPKLARLHPAELADLVEEASRREAEEIVAAAALDPEREADLFEELPTGRQLELLGDRTDAEVAAVLARMESDDAADLASELPEERREGVLELLPATQRRRVRALLGYDPATAGGLMSPEIATVFSQATAAEALARIRLSAAAPEVLAAVFVVSASRRLKGAVALPDLVRADPGATVSELCGAVRSVRADAVTEEVARLMSDFDLTVVPVVDEDERPLGVVTVDDVLELVLPRGWGRRFGLLGED